MKKIFQRELSYLGQRLLTIFLVFVCVGMTHDFIQAQENEIEFDEMIYRREGSPFGETSDLELRNSLYDGLNAVNGQRCQQEFFNLRPINDSSELCHPFVNLKMKVCHLEINSQKTRNFFILSIYNEKMSLGDAPLRILVNESVMAHSAYRETYVMRERLVVQGKTTNEKLEEKKYLMNNPLYSTIDVYSKNNRITLSLKAKILDPKKRSTQKCVFSLEETARF